MFSLLLLLFMLLCYLYSNSLFIKVIYKLIFLSLKLLKKPDEAVATAQQVFD